MSQAPRLNFDLDTVREVAQLLRDSDLAEVCIETTGDDGENGARLLLRRSSPTPVAPQMVMVPPVIGQAAPEAASGEVAAAESAAVRREVPSPAVGLFHPAPKNPVKEGDLVKAGQALGIVESLRVPNEVGAPIAGRLVEIRCHDGQGVEFGQVLFVIEEEA